MAKPKLGLGLVLGLLAGAALLAHYLTRLAGCPEGGASAGPGQRARLLVLVLSAPDNEARRAAIRASWLRPRPGHEVRGFFAVGTRGLEPERQRRLANEAPDLLLLPELTDSYFTITKKLLHSLVSLHRDFSFDFLLKADDDSFVLVDELLRELVRWESRGSRQELYWGYFNGRARVKRSGAWREPDWFLCDYYLPYALGGGYLLSYNLVSFIARNADILKLHNSEDVSVGLWLAPLANIERKHDVRFDTEYRSRGCSNRYLVTHKQSVQDINRLHEHYTRTGNLCADEVSNYLGYQYNWTLPPSQCCERRPGIP